MSKSAAPAKGLEGVVAANTRLSDVKGDVGELIYCGYNINELAGKVTYEEVVHLLHYNHLPNKAELAELKSRLAAARDLPEAIIRVIKGVPKPHRRCTRSARRFPPWDASMITRMMRAWTPTATRRFG